MKNIASDNGIQAPFNADIFQLSPLTTTGIQARNFTAGFTLGEDCFAPDFYTETSLKTDISELCDPDVDVSPERLFNIVVKFFCSYVDETAHHRAVPFVELMGLYENFGRHQSLNEPDDNIEIMNRMRQLSGALRVLADAPRMAHMLRNVVSLEVREDGRDQYVGIDMGTATGIMMVALHIHARRNCFEDVTIRGFTNDPVAGERTHDLIRSLGAGDVLRMDPARPQAHSWLGEFKPVFVVNEMLSGMQRMLKSGNFFSRYKALFLAAPEAAGEAIFHPEGIIAYSREANMSLILSPENGYSAPSEYVDSAFTPQGFLANGEVTPTHRLGEDFYRYLVSTSD